ncbi:MAG TPA: DMT family transporter, partial [Gemmatimonadales bacterium]|nr:DMT family transporter [Gemmatimonadales bacterium]
PSELTVRPSARPPVTADAGMLLVTLIWGTNFTAMKIGLEAMPPLAFTALRFVSSSLLLCAILRIRTGRLSIPKGLFWPLVGLGVLGNTLYQLAFTIGLALSTATNCALILSTMPAVVATLGHLTGVEHATRRMWWGIGIATVGVALVVAARGVAFTASTLRGDLLAIAATLFWASYTLGLRRLPKTISTLEVTTLATLTGTPGLVLAGLPAILGLGWGAVPLRAWLAMAYASVLSLVVAYFIWNASVARVGSNRTAIYMCITPIVAAIVAWLVLGERLLPLQGVGAVLIVAGVLLTRK